MRRMSPFHHRAIRRRIHRRLRYIVLTPRRIIRLNIHQLTRNPCPMKTLLTNWKDILAFLAVAAIFNILADVVTRLSVTGNDVVGLANLVGMLKGFSNFVGANLCAWMIGIAIAWPTLNRFSNDGFAAAWNSLTIEKQLYLFTVVATLELIAAAICFSA
jgi:hypothetical protein